MIRPVNTTRAVCRLGKTIERRPHYCNYCESRPCRHHDTPPHLLHGGPLHGHECDTHIHPNLVRWHELDMMDSTPCGADAELIGLYA